MVDTAPDLYQKGDFSPEKRMKGIFVYVLKNMLTLAKMQCSDPVIGPSTAT